jgi:hypothetical protein
MIKYILKNKFAFSFLFIIFIYFNIRIILNFGLYDDDWSFYTRANNNNFEDWVITVWKGEAVWVRRHIAAPFYIFFHLFSVSVLYIISLILSLITISLIFAVFSKILFAQYYSKNGSDFYLSTVLLILSWYFFPFNIGGQFWLTGAVHTKLATIFFLFHIILLINKRIFLSLIFLILCFNSYEIYFFIYLPIILIFFFRKKIEIGNLKKYIFFSTIIQIFFLVDKKRKEQDINISQFFYDFFENIPRFFWSIFSSVPENFSLKVKIILLIAVFSLAIIIFFYSFNLKNKNEKKFKAITLICILFSLACSSLIHVIGTYGYWGKGIFSRTMYVPSLLILITLLIFVPILKKKLNLTISYIIFFLTLFFFNIEMINWEKSKKIQEEIINNFLVKKEDIFLNKTKDLILFFGPCYYNGIGIFTALYDLQNAILYKSKNFSKIDAIVPIQNWTIENNNYSSLKIHNFEYQINEFDNIYLWNYFDEKRSKIISKKIGTKNIVKQVLQMRNDQNCSIGVDEYLRAKNAKTNFLKVFNF